MAGIPQQPQPGRRYLQPTPSDPGGRPIPLSPSSALYPTRTNPLASEMEPYDSEYRGVGRPFSGGGAGPIQQGPYLEARGGVSAALQDDVYAHMRTDSQWPSYRESPRIELGDVQGFRQGGPTVAIGGAGGPDGGVPPGGGYPHDGRRLAWDRPVGAQHYAGGYAQRDSAPAPVAASLGVGAK
jgi:hypothetical protein